MIYLLLIFFIVWNRRYHAWAIQKKLNKKGPRNRGINKQSLIYLKKCDKINAQVQVNAPNGVVCLLFVYLPFLFKKKSQVECFSLKFIETFRGKITNKKKTGTRALWHLSAKCKLTQCVWESWCECKKRNARNKANSRTIMSQAAIVYVPSADTFRVLYFRSMRKPFKNHFSFKFTLHNAPKRIFSNFCFSLFVSKDQDNQSYVLLPSVCGHRYFGHVFSMFVYTFCANTVNELSAKSRRKKNSKINCAGRTLMHVQYIYVYFQTMEIIQLLRSTS